jgi:hypothetical protein
MAYSYNRMARGKNQNNIDGYIHLDWTRRIDLKVKGEEENENRRNEEKDRKILSLIG